MFKLALCVKRTDLYSVFPFIPRQYNPLENPTSIIFPYDYNEVSSLDTYILDRDDCETMPEFLQLIPYISITTGNPEKFFIYTRGDLGNENRLHGLCSLGLGGHIEDSLEHPNDIYSFEKTVVEAALRELEEEAGIVLALDEYQDFKDVWRKHSKLIYDDTDPVGSVHIGLHITLSVHPSRLADLEQGVITKGKWLSVKEIKSAIANNSIQLENWSNTLLQSLTGNDAKYKLV
jgi:predicted NUDIX family phosphoesterase